MQPFPTQSGSYSPRSAMPIPNPRSGAMPNEAPALIPPPPLPPAPTRHGRRRVNRRILHGVGYGLTALVFFAAGAYAATLSAQHRMAGALAGLPQVTATATRTAAPAAGPAATASHPAATNPAAPHPATTFSDGGNASATVGAQMAAGTWRVKGAPGDCYWQITRTGHPADIIDNHTGGGTQRVTLRKGQDFESNDCGTWKRS